jgi:ferritin
MANWMKIQYLEETSHAMKLYDFIISRGGVAKLAAIDAVPTEWKSITEVFEETYKHECIVTEMIHNCYHVATTEKDYATTNMLQWFIDEQVEEEESAREMISALEAVECNKYGMYMLDKEMATRVYAAPSPLTTAE